MKLSFCNFIYLLSVILLSQSHLCFGDQQDVLGCGGFIVADKSIDFSKINVELLTDTGALKYETECAPHNGYFFIPIYETGSYRLRVSPPLGWTFKEHEVAINIDGENDVCSQNKDILFEFAGFGVIGRILAAGESVGPSGVNIDLLSQDEKTVVQKTVTVKDGSYVFTAVSGADHKVRATHPTWRFEKDVGSVVITGDNGEAEDLIVAGFDLSGKVVSADLPMAGVNILLFGTEGKKVLCEDNTLESSVRGPVGSIQLCKTVTNSKGGFVFDVVPPGKYHLVPYYHSLTTRFEVAPAMKEVTVGLDSFSLADPFKVQGFSVKGKVVVSPDGDPIADAKVTVSGGEKAHKAVTDANGEYFVDKIATGKYKITVEKAGMEFTSSTVNISPSEPVLPEVTLSKLKVTGQLDFSTVGPDADRKVKVASTGKPDILLSIQQDGLFEVMLEPAPYSFSIVSSASDEQMGNLFAPLNTDIILKSSPVSDLFFSPVRVTIAGKVSCLGDCDDIIVVLSPDAPTSEPAQQRVVNGVYRFQNQLPGSYSLSVKESAFCWDSPSIVFNIGSESKEDLNFAQTGWVMDVHSTHSTGIKYTSSNGKDVGEVDLQAGASQLCMKMNSEYTIQSSSCHQFQGENKGFKWTPGHKLILKSEKHVVSGRVSCVESIPDLQIVVDSTSERSTKALSQSEVVNGLYQYKFSFYSNPHEDINIEPQASKFLFDPAKLMISMGDDCSLNSAIFSATKGLFVQGSVTPALEGAKITIKSESLPEPVTTSTDAKGKYSVGPFPRDLAYTVDAEKIGFVISNLEQKGHFSAKKLASIVVNIRDEAGKSLGEVVVSLSGGEQNFRTNQQTGENGSISFLALAPGEYFIKPMLKEYEFVPKNKLITVTEGTEEVISITAKRVAVSVFGSLVGLKGDPEPGITVEVVGEADGCRGHQEEATSAPTGNFRIRGLKRGCEYRLALKQMKSNNAVERTIPAVKKLKTDNEDITGIEMIALRPRTTMDTSLLVKVKKDTIKNVKAKLFCGDNQIQSVKLDTVKFVIFQSIAADGKQCMISVEANSIHVNQRVKGHKIEFVADKPFQHFTVELVVESSLAQGEIGQAGWATLPLVILLVTSLLHWDKLSPHAKNLAALAEQKLLKHRAVISAKNAARAPVEDEEMTAEDLDKTVRFVEASTRKKKVKKI